MSTDLYGVRVLALDPAARRVRFRVFVVYYDVAYKNHMPLPDDPSFFMRVLRLGGWGESSALLAAQVSQDEALDEAWVDANTWRFVAKVERLATRNWPLEDYDGYSDFYYERDGQWKDEERLVQADYDVTVTDGRYLEHFTVGESWGTTAYPTEADTALEEALSLPNPGVVAHTLAPFEGRSGEEGTPEQATWSPDGRWLALVSEANEVVVYEVGTWAERWRLQGDTMFGRAGFMAERPWVFVTDGMGQQRPKVWELEGGQEVEASLPAGFYVSTGGQWAVGYGDNERLTFRDGAGATLWVVEPDHGFVDRYAFSPDESLLVTVGGEGQVRLWDVKTRKLMGSMNLEGRVWSLAPSPDGRYLAVALLGPRGRHPLVLLRVSDGVEVRRTAVRAGFLKGLAWSPDGRWLASITLGVDGYSGGLRIHGVAPAVSGVEAAVQEAAPDVASNDEAAPTSGGLDRAMMRQLAEGAAPLEASAWEAVLAAHARFVASGGGEGSWQTVEVSGLTLAVYLGAAGTEGEQATLRFGNLTGVATRGASLPWAVLTGIFVEDGDFEGADLQGSSITDAWLPRARLGGADLRGADLSRANLRGADLRGADLRGTDLEKADLRDVDFTGARIGGIKLGGALLEGSQGFGEA